MFRPSVAPFLGAQPSKKLLALLCRILEPLFETAESNSTYLLLQREDTKSPMLYICFQLSLLCMYIGMLEQQGQDDGSDVMLW